MPTINNTISLRTDMIPYLDEAYRLGSLSGVLDAGREFIDIQAGAFKIAEMNLDGLASHDRANGGQYVAGNTNLIWREYVPTYSRNRKFGVDAADNVETADIAFGMLASQFIKEKLIPELDAWRFSRYFKEALAEQIVEETIVDGETLTKSVNTAITLLEENEVPQETSYLFGTPTVLNQAMLLKTFESVRMFDWFDGRIHKIPVRRFQTDIKLLDGKTAGEEKGGFEKTAASQDINYAVINKEAVIQGLKHVAPKYTPAGINQLADGDEYAYRVDGVELVKHQKKNGLYFSIAPKGE